MLWFREAGFSLRLSERSGTILGGGMRVRNELGDAGMWALVPLLLSLGGGFLLFISIFAGEFESSGTFFAGGAAALLGLTFASLMGVRGCIVAPALIAVGVFGGWVWEQFRDGASIDAVTYIGGKYDYLGVGYDGSHWVGNVDNYEERTATVTCQLEVLGPEGEVIGTVDVTATDVRPNGGQSVEGDIDIPSLTRAAAQAKPWTKLRNLRSTCTTEIG
jgi:hypothetical protein